MGKIYYSYTFGNRTLGDEIPLSALLIGIGITLAVYLTFYLLRSIGIYTLAKNNGVKSYKLAWVPILWIYPTILLVGEYKFFGKKFSQLATLLTVLFSLASVCLLAYQVLLYFPITGYFFSGGDVYMGENASALAKGLTEYWLPDVYVSNLINLYYDELLLDTIGVVADLLDIVSIIIQVNIYLALFRRFLPRHFILAGIVSIFGGFPIFVFAVRKNRPIEEVLKDYANRNRYGNPYGSPYNNPYGNPYQNSNGGQGGYGSAQNKQNTAEPFEEFNSDDEPFSEIFDKKKNGDNR